MNRSASLARTGPIRWTPPERTPEEEAARATVEERSGGRCEAGCGRPGTDYSHRLAEGQGGPTTVQNGCRLCRACHSWAEQHPAAADACGLHVASWDDPVTARVWLQPYTAWPAWYLLDEEGLYVAVDTDDGPPAAYPCPIRGPVSGPPATIDPAQPATRSQP